MSGTPAGFDNDLFDGIAQMLADASIGQYSSDTSYADDATAITMQKLPATPDNAIAITPYPVSDDPTLSDSVVGIQVRTRTGGMDPRTTNELAGSVFNQLQGLRNTTLSSGVRIVLCERRSGALNGQDDVSRWERVDNYYATVWRPSAHRE